MDIYLCRYIIFMLETLDWDIVKLENRFSFHPNEVYYYNAHRNQELILLLQWRCDNFDTKHIHDIFQESLGIDWIKDIKINSTRGAWHVVAFVETENHTYVYRQTIALANPESYMLFEKDFVNEFKTIWVNSVDILAYWSKPWFERQIMEVLPDQNINELTLTQEQYNYISAQIGQIIAKQYHLPHEWWGRIVKENGGLKWFRKTHYDHFTAYLDYDLELMWLSQIVNKTGIELLKNHLAWDRIREVFGKTKSFLIHNDLPDHNVRVNKKTLNITAVYDFENTVFSDPISELGSLPTWASQYPKKKQIIEWFNTYVQNAKLAHKADLTNFDEKVALYFLRTILRKMPLAIKGKKLTSRHIGLFNEAIQDNRLDGKIKVNPEAIKILVGSR